MSLSGISSVISSAFNLPDISSGLFKVTKRNFLEFKKNWIMQIVSSAVEPMIIFIVLGVGIGTLVRNVGGMSYIEFLFPGFICLSAFYLGFVDCVDSILSKKTKKFSYVPYILSPLKNEDVALGEILWSTLKSIVSVSSLFLVYASFTNSPLIETLPIYLLVCLLVWMGSSFGAFTSTIVKSSNSKILLISAGVFAVSSINGVFFPSEVLPEWLWGISLLSPVTHAVILARSPLNFFHDYQLFLNVAALFSFLIVLTNLAANRFNLKS